MYKNLLIYSSIIIICIILFLIFLKFKNNNYESFGIPNYISNYENINLEEINTKQINIEPDYKYENITEYNFNRLFNKIEIINKEKINLKNKSNYNFYTQSTTDDKLRMDLDQISSFVISILNNDNYYDFNKTNFGDVEIWIDEIGNEELKYELFLWDKKNYFELKILVNIIKFVKENEALKYGVRDSPYIFPDFNIGLPFKDQIIPLPTDVIISGNFDTGVSSINRNEPSEIKFLYLNQIQIQNSTLIVDYQKNKYPFNRINVNETEFSGITDSTLEYVNIINKSVDAPFLENGRKYNKWPTLDEEPKWKGQFPAKYPPVKKWDDNGIYYYEKENENNEDMNDNIIFTKEDSKEDVSRYCDTYKPGTRWSEDKMPLQPDFWASNYTVNSTCGENFWLFDNSRVVGGNTFIGGGKR